MWVAVPKSKYIKSKYIKSKYIKSKYILICILISKLNIRPYNIKLNYLLSRLIVNTKTSNIYYIFIKRKLKNYYYKNTNIMYLKKQYYYSNCKYYHSKNKLRYLYNFI